jgi:hypothetical protein
MNFLRGAGMFLPILFVALIGFRLECINIDVLHTVDQGVSSHVSANVFWHIAVVRNAFGGATQLERIKNLNTYLKEWYKKNQTLRRIQGNLTTERVRTSGGWPKLKAKAAATRHCILFCIHLMETFGDFAAPDNEDFKILGLCNLLQRFYHLMNMESQFWSPEAAAEIPELSMTMAALYASLASTAFAEGIKAWKMMPKLHLLQHLLEHFGYQGNPRFFWTYQDEDLVGELIKVARTVHVNTLAVSVLFKWMIHVFG